MCLVEVGGGADPDPRIFLPGLDKEKSWGRILAHRQSPPCVEGRLQKSNKHDKNDQAA